MTNVVALFLAGIVSNVPSLVPRPPPLFGNEAGIVSNVPTWFVKVNLCITTGPKKGAGLAHMQLARSNQGMRVVCMHTRVR